MIKITTVKELKDFTCRKKEEGLTIGFVPTMGALHQGHLTLIRRARKENDLTVVSVFVNPIQFNNPVDLEKYPRDLEKDMQLLAGEGCDVVFAPAVEEMYPAGEEPSSPVVLGNLEKVMEGKFRPGHFQGVVIVVSKFFRIIEPHHAYFGKKDFQQLQIIRHMVKTLSMPVEIIAVDTVREDDGLAMSSRNLRLAPEHRAVAPKIHETLTWVKSQAGSIPPSELARLAVEKLEKTPGLRVDYFEIVDPETLMQVDKWVKGRPAVACTAVYAGDIRLIDNMEVFS